MAQLLKLRDDRRQHRQRNKDQQDGKSAIVGIRLPPPEPTPSSRSLGRNPARGRDWLPTA